MPRLRLIALAVVLTLAAACQPAPAATPTAPAATPTAPAATPTSTVAPPTPTQPPPSATPVPATATAVEATGVVLFRGDPQRTGQTDSPALRARPEIAWQKSGLGLGVHGGPLLADGVLYLPTQIDRLRALDPATGAELWSVGPSGGDGIVSSPAVADGTIYIGRDKVFYALDAADGTEQWTYRAKALLFSAPLVVGETVYVFAQNGDAAALDRQTGEVRWTAKLGGFVLWPSAYADGRLFVSNGETMLALDPDTGDELWHTPPSVNWAPQAVADGRVYAGNGDGAFYALDAATGETVWHYQTEDGQDWGGAAVGGGRVFAGNRNQNVYAFDAATGALDWSFATEDWAVGDPMLAGEVLYVGVGNHLMNPHEGPRPLYALDAATGAELWRFAGDGRLLAAPEAAGGMIYVLTATGTLYALK